MLPRFVYVVPFACMSIYEKIGSIFLFLQAQRYLWLLKKLVSKIATETYL